MNPPSSPPSSSPSSATPVPSAAAAEDKGGANTILGPMRIPFLVLTPICVLVGAGTASYAGSSIDGVHLVLVFVGATAAHVAVNALNEYHDFLNGLDYKTNKTPFSGGSGALPDRPEKGHHGLFVGIAALTLTLGIGAFFVYLRGLLLVPIGVLGILIVLTYTPWLTKRPLLCLLAPGLGFGPAMVVGSHVALTGEYSWAALMASAVPFFLVSDLLLLNQFPDIEADRSVGRRHFPILLGPQKSAKLYALMLLGAYLSILLGYIFGVFPAYALMATATLILAVFTIRGVLRYSDRVDKLLPYLGMNVVLNLLTPLLVATGLFLA